MNGDKPVTTFLLYIAILFASKMRLTSFHFSDTVEILTGDFNGDGRTDIALVKTSGIDWPNFPMAFADGAGKWKVTNSGAANFAKKWAIESPAKVITGDFNGDKRTDIALVITVRNPTTYSTYRKTVPIAFANGDGTWPIRNEISGTNGEFVTRASDHGVK